MRPANFSISIDRVRRRMTYRGTLLPALVLCTALAVLIKLPVWMSPGDHFGGSADGLQAMWFLTWTPFAIAHHHNPLLSNYVNYPQGINLMWNTSMPVLGVLLWPVTAIWSAVVTYNVITTSAIALSAFFAFIAIRRYVRNPYAAFAGALLYGFSPALVVQDISHANIAFSFVTIPLVLLVLDELLVRQRLHAALLGVLIAVLGAFQFLVFSEFFATEVVAVVVVTAVLALSARGCIRLRWQYSARALAVAVPLLALLLAYPAYIQLAGPNRVTGQLHNPDAYATDLLNPVVPTAYLFFAPQRAVQLAAHFSSNGSEADGYLGIPIVLLVVFMLVRFWKTLLVRAAAITALIMFLLSLGGTLIIGGSDTGIRLPWHYVERHVPLLGNVLPARMMAYVFLACALILAFATARVWAARPRWQRSFAPALAVAMLLPLFPRVPLLTNSVAVPRYFTTRAVDTIPDGASVVAVPWPTFLNMDAMNWQMASRMRFRLVGGYFLGPVAPGQDALMNVSQAFSSASLPTPPSRVEVVAFLNQLHTNDISAVLVGPVPQQAAAARFFDGVLGSAPQRSDGVDVWLLRPAR